MDGQKLKQMFGFGTKVIFVEEYDLFPHALIEKGEIGIVVSNDESGLWIKLDKHHEGLCNWDNNAQFGQDERSTEEYIAIASSLSYDVLESFGFGKCDNCGDVLEIGRGDNFFWDEENSRWLCTPCMDDDTKPEDKIFSASWEDEYSGEESFQPGNTDHLTKDFFCDNNGYDLEEYQKVMSLKVGESINFNESGEHKITRVK
jgi:hypothetical protein